MTLQMRDNENIEKGRAEGREEGREEGEKRFGMLTSRLLKDNRIEDLQKASVDAQYREKLYKEYGMI